jgi:hypothetical protein
MLPLVGRYGNAGKVSNDKSFLSCSGRSIFPEDFCANLGNEFGSILVDKSQTTLATVQ